MSRVLAATALVLTDRRWAAALSAIALGFGLFVGVAIGPGAAGTLATGTPQIVELPGPSDAVAEESEVASGVGSPGPVHTGRGGGGEASPPEAFPSSVPLESESVEPPPVEPSTAPPNQEAPPAPEDQAPEEEPEDEEQSLSGVVVHSNSAAGSYALAIAGGGLVAVHSRAIPSAGTKLSTPVRQLANGTFAESSEPKREGRAATASFSGAVTYVDSDPASPGYTVSGRGASVLVRVVPDPAGALPALPPLGSFATVDVRIAKPEPITPEAAAPAPEAPPDACGSGVPAPAPLPAVEAPAATLWQSRVTVDGEPATHLELAAIVTGLCPGGQVLLLSSDDSREGGGDLVLAVPPKISTAELQPGDPVLASAEIGEAGDLTLTGLVGDERVKGADDPKTAQGDLSAGQHLRRQREGAPDYSQIG